MKTVPKLRLRISALAFVLAVLLGASSTQATHAQSTYPLAADLRPDPSTRAGKTPRPSLFSPPAQARPITFDHLTMRDGLSNDGVPGIVQDDRGFIWFATYDGLNRYDGYEFRVYRHDAEDPGSLSDNPIRILYKDRDGELWIGTWFGGLNRFDRETETFVRYLHDPDDPHSLSDNSVWALYQDRSGVLWIGTWTGGSIASNPKHSKRVPRVRRLGQARRRLPTIATIPTIPIA